MDAEYCSVSRLIACSATVASRTAFGACEGIGDSCRHPLSVNSADSETKMNVLLDLRFMAAPPPALFENRRSSSNRKGPLADIGSAHLPGKTAASANR